MDPVATNGSQTLPLSANKVEQSSTYPKSSTTESFEVKIGANGKLECEPPSFLKSVDELRNLATVMHAFKARWDELQKHLEFIENALEREERLAMKSQAEQQVQQQHSANAVSTTGAVASDPGVSDVSDVKKPLGTVAMEVSDTNKLSNFSAVNASNIDSSSKSSSVKVPDPVKSLDPDRTSSVDAMKVSDSVELSNTKAMDASNSDKSDLGLVSEAEEKHSDDKTHSNSRGSELENICQKMCGSDLRRYIRAHISDYKKLRQEVPAALKMAPNPTRLVLDCVGKFYLQGSKAYCKGSTMISARQASIFVMEFFLLIGGCDEMDLSIKEEAENGAVAWRKRIITEGGLSKATDMDARGLLLFVSCFGIPNVFTLEDLVRLIRLSSPREIGEALRKSTFLVPRIPEIIESLKDNGSEVEAVDIIYMFRLEHKFSPMRILMSILKKLKEDRDDVREAHGSPYLLHKAYEKRLDSLKSMVSCLEAHKVDPAKLLPGWPLKDMITKLERDVSDLAKRKHDDLDPSRRLETQGNKRSRVVSESSSTPTRFSGLQALYATKSNLRPAASSSHHDYVPAYYPENPVGTGLRAGLLSDGVSVGPSLVQHSPLGVHRGRLVENHDPLTARDGWIRDRLMVQSPALYPSHSYLERSLSSVERFPGLSHPPSAGVSDLYQFADAVTERDYASIVRGGAAITERDYASVVRGGAGSTLPASSSYRSYLY